MRFKEKEKNRMRTLRSRSGCPLIQTCLLCIHVSVDLVIETLFEYQQFDVTVLVVCSLAKLIHNKL